MQDGSIQVITLNSPQELAKKIFNRLDISQATRADYQARIGLFLKFLAINPLNRDSFLLFKRYLSERTDLSVTTKNKYLASTRVFLKALNRQGVIPVDITQNIKTFSHSKKHKRDGLNNKEV